MSPLKLQRPNLLSSPVLRRYSLFVLENNTDETAQPNDDSTEARRPLAAFQGAAGKHGSPNRIWNRVSKPRSVLK
jgi:hypothetical protein